MRTPENSDAREFWLIGREPNAVRDLVAGIEEELPHLSDEPERAERLCSLLEPIGAAVHGLLPPRSLELLGRAAVESWLSLRFASQDEEVIPLALSWQRLRWCWLFSWERELDELCSRDVFLDDCLRPPVLDQTRYLVAEDVAENCLLLSLTSQHQRVPAGPSLDRLFEEHLHAGLRYIEAATDTMPAGTVGAGARLILGDSYPTDIPSLEMRERWCFGDGQGHDPDIVSGVYDACWHLWRMRLALAILRRRGNESANRYGMT